MPTKEVLLSKTTYNNNTIFYAKKKNAQNNILIFCASDQEGIFQEGHNCKTDRVSTFIVYLKRKYDCNNNNMKKKEKKTIREDLLCP